MNGGTWTTVRRVRLRQDGRFTVTVAPRGTRATASRRRSGPARRSPSRVADGSPNTDDMTHGPRIAVLGCAGSSCSPAPWRRCWPSLSPPKRLRSSATAFRTTPGWSTGQERSTSGSTSSTGSASISFAFTIHWNEVEKVRGKKNWGHVDAVLEGLDDGGIAPWSRSTGRRAGRTGAGRRTGRRDQAPRRGVCRRRCKAISLGEAVARLERAGPAAVVAADHAADVCDEAAQSGVLRDSRCDTRREGRWWRDCATRLDRRRLACGLDPGHGDHERTPGRVRAQSVSTQSPRDAVVRRLRALRDDHDVDARAITAGGVACFRLADADLAERIRLPDETARCALGVSRAFQARYVGEAAHRAFTARDVDMLIQYLYQDEPDVARWQSGYIAAWEHQALVSGRPAPAGTGVPHRRSHRAVGAGAIRARAAEVRARGVLGTAPGAGSAGSRRRARTAFSSAGPFKRGRARRLPALVPVGQRREARRFASLSPVRAAALEERAQSLLALVARAALRDPARWLRSVGPVEDELLRMPRGTRRPALASSATIWSTALSRSAVTSCTSPIRSAVAASKRSPVTK